MYYFLIKPQPCPFCFEDSVRLTEHSLRKRDDYCLRTLFASRDLCAQVRIRDVHFVTFILANDGRPKLRALHFTHAKLHMTFQILQPSLTNVTVDIDRTFEKEGIRRQ